MNPRISVDVSFERGDTCRLYYLISTSPAPSETEKKELTRFIEKLREDALEVRDINPGRREEDSKIPQDFKGYAVSILKHDIDDEDYTPPEALGLDPSVDTRGYNASEAYKKVNTVWGSLFDGDMQLSPEAAKHMSEFIKAADISIPFTPAFRGAHVTLMRMIVSNQNDTDLNEVVNSHHQELLNAIVDARSVVNELSAKPIEGFSEGELEEFKEAQNDLSDMVKLHDLYVKRTIDNSEGEGKETDNQTQEVISVHIQELEEAIDEASNNILSYESMLPEPGAKEALESEQRNFENLTEQLNNYKKQLSEFNDVKGHNNSPKIDKGEGKETDNQTQKVISVHIQELKEAIDEATNNISSYKAMLSEPGAWEALVKEQSHLKNLTEQLNSYKK